MWRRLGILAIASALVAAAAPQGCVGGVSVGTFRLAVSPPSGSTANYLAMRRVNNIPGAQGGLSVTELPRPVPGEGARQTLRIAMPWPSPTPKSPLFIWLRGESEGRATRITQ